MEKAPQQPAQPPRPRDDVRVAANRCPYCRDDVDAEGSAVCESCLTRHHAACWDEGGSCSACGSTARLSRATAAPAPQHAVVDPEWPAPAAPDHCRYYGCERPNEWTSGPGGPFYWCEEHARLHHARAALALSILSAIGGVLAILFGLLAISKNPALFLLSFAVGAPPLGLLIYKLRHGPRRQAERSFETQWFKR